MYRPSSRSPPQRHCAGRNGLRAVRAESNSALPCPPHAPPRPYSDGDNATFQIYSIGVPRGAMPLASTVFGNSPEPQRMNEWKSLYQSPLGDEGSVLTQSCNLPRSSRGICRSATRARICSQIGRGRLENRIFGNSVLPEDCSDQILPSLAFTLRIGFGHEPPIRLAETVPRRRFRLHAALR